MSERIIEQQPWRLFTPTGEEKALYPLLAFSIFAHILFFLIDKNALFRSTKPLFEEWSVEAELVQDLNSGAASKSALPRSELAEEAKVPTNLLPQLPKNYAVEQPQTNEAGEPLDENTPEENKPTVADTPQENPNLNKPEGDNKIAMQDALKRLALEKLRQDQKFANTFKAESTDGAKLKSEGESAQGAGLSGAAQGRYRNDLKAHIGKFWSIPESYSIKDANLRVAIAIVVDSSGHLVSSEIRETSGDNVFDQLAYAAVKNSVPLPKPPASAANRDVEVLLNFTPKSF